MVLMVMVIIMFTAAVTRDAVLDRVRNESACHAARDLAYCAVHQLAAQVCAARAAYGAGEQTAFTVGGLA